MKCTKNLENKPTKGQHILWFSAQNCTIITLMCCAENLLSGYASFQVENPCETDRWTRPVLWPVKMTAQHIQNTMTAKALTYPIRDRGLTYIYLSYYSALKLLQIIRTPYRCQQLFHRKMQVRFAKKTTPIITLFPKKVVSQNQLSSVGGMQIFFRTAITNSYCLCSTEIWWQYCTDRTIHSPSRV